jgi:predicted TPR repeat methyltransferase
MNELVKKTTDDDVDYQILNRFLKPNKDPKMVELEFDEISEIYDTTVEGTGYTLARDGALVLSRFVTLEQKILDAGCGTGLVGGHLGSLGYKNIFGIDLSSRSLDVARQKGVYESLIKHNLQEILPFEDNCFDATICIAVFSRFNTEDLTEILKEFSRVTRSGGVIAFSQRENLQNGVQIDDLVKTISGIQIQFVTEAAQAAPLAKEHANILVRYYVLKNLKS